MSRCEHEGGPVVLVAHGDHFVCLVRLLGGGVRLRRVEDVLHTIGRDLVKRFVGAGGFFSFLNEDPYLFAGLCWNVFKRLLHKKRIQFGRHQHA